MANQPDVAAELERVTTERDQAWRDALAWRRRAEAVEAGVSFFREFFTVGGNGEGWSVPHVLAVAAVLAGVATESQRHIASIVVDLDALPAPEDV